MSDLSERGRIIGKYEVVARLSVGGMAELFLACAVGPGGFKKFVALKQILPEVRSDASFVQMFLDEARITAALVHPNVGQVFDLGLDPAHDDLYLAMEFISGQNLARLMRVTERAGQRLPLAVSCRIMHDVCLGLHAAHALTDASGKSLGVVHRDVTPKNVMVSYAGHVKVIDFGIARARGNLRATMPGQVRGTLSYISPEQVLDHPLDARTDVFAAGTVLYELLTGKKLHPDEIAAPRAVVVDTPPPPSSLNPEVPPALDAAVMKALAKSPDQRHQTARAFARELGEVVKLAYEEDVSALMESLFSERRRATQALLESLSSESVEDAKLSAYLTGLVESGSGSHARGKTPLGQHLPTKQERAVTLTPAPAAVVGDGAAREVTQLEKPRGVALTPAPVQVHDEGRDVTLVEKARGAPTTSSPQVSDEAASAALVGDDARDVTLVGGDANGASVVAKERGAPTSAALVGDDARDVTLVGGDANGASVVAKERGAPTSAALVGDDPKVAPLAPKEETKKPRAGALVAVAAEKPRVVTLTPESVKESDAAILGDMLLEPTREVKFRMPKEALREPELETTREVKFQVVPKEALREPELPSVAPRVPLWQQTVPMYVSPLAPSISGAAALPFAPGPTVVSPAPATSSAPPGAPMSGPGVVAPPAASPRPPGAPMSFAPAPGAAPLSFPPAPGAPMSFAPAPAAVAAPAASPRPPGAPMSFAPAPGAAPMSFAPAPGAAPLSFPPAPGAPMSFAPADQPSAPVDPSVVPGVLLPDEPAPDQGKKRRERPDGAKRTTPMWGPEATHTASAAEASAEFAKLKAPVDEKKKAPVEGGETGLKLFDDEPPPAPEEPKTPLSAYEKARWFFAVVLLLAAIFVVVGFFKKELAAKPKPVPAASP